MNRKNIYFIITTAIIAITMLSMISVAAVRAGDEVVEVEDPTTTISEAYIPSETTTLESVITTTTTTTEVVTTSQTTKKREESTTKKQETSTSVKVSTTKPTENHPDTTTKPATTTKPVSGTWAEKAKKYPEATQIWLYMKDLGWSDAVCAGIMGNLMAEVGGQTLDLSRWRQYSNGSYYGVCQWSRKYYPGVIGRNIAGQCDFLRDTIKKEIDTYGRNYAQGMNFNKFLQLTNPRDVALCFAKSYERCASAYYSVRQSNAEKAYAYFVG